MIAMQKEFAKSDWRNQLQIARALQKGVEKSPGSCTVVEPRIRPFRSVIWTLWAATYLLCAIRCKLHVYSARSSLMVFWPGNASLSSLCCRKANWILRNTIVAWNWLTYDFTNHVLTCNAPINVSSLFAVKTARCWSLLALYGALHAIVCHWRSAKASHFLRFWPFMQIYICLNIHASIHTGMR